MATRDEVWHTVLMKLVQSGKFKISELDVEASTQTIRRVCRFMESKGWLVRDSPSSSIWRRGPLASILLAERKPKDDEDYTLGEIHVDDLYEAVMDKFSPPDEK